MKMQDQVCSLELAKKLCELDVEQNSYMQWWLYDDNWPHVIIPHLMVPRPRSGRVYSAFTAAELGELLPNIVTFKHGAPFNNFRLVINKFYIIDKSVKTNNYVINYECDTFSENQPEHFRKKFMLNIYNKNLANAMAEMKIRLLENTEEIT